MDMKQNRKALIVVTSHDTLGKTGRKTGFYFDEMATPYWSLTDAGYAVDLASPRGGNAPFDPGSLPKPGESKPAVQRFLDDAAAMAKVEASLAVVDADPAAYDAVFLAGGHGTMWDFTNPALARFIGKAWDTGAVVGAVCHGPAGLVNAVRADGKPLVENLRVNSFTDAEEEAVGLTGEVPFLLETELRRRGARFESSGNFQPHAVRDGRLVTGQNPASVSKVAGLLLEALAQTSKRGAA